MTATEQKYDDPRYAGASMSVDTVHFDAVRANIKVAGELDMATAAPLWAVLQGHLASGRRYVRLDLSEVTFLDATALGGITRAHQDFLAARGTLVITGVRTRVSRVLRLTGLDEVLFIGGSRADDDTFDSTEHSDLLRAGLFADPLAGDDLEPVAD